MSQVEETAPEQEPERPPTAVLDRPEPQSVPTDAAALELLDAKDAVIAMQRTAGNRKTTKWIERTGDHSGVLRSSRARQHMGSGARLARQNGHHDAGAPAGTSLPPSPAAAAAAQSPEAGEAVAEVGRGEVPPEAAHALPPQATPGIGTGGPPPGNPPGAPAGGAGAPASPGAPAGSGAPAASGAPAGSGAPAAPSAPGTPPAPGGPTGTATPTGATAPASPEGAAAPSGPGGSQPAGGQRPARPAGEGGQHADPEPGGGGAGGRGDRPVRLNELAEYTREKHWHDQWAAGGRATRGEESETGSLIAHALGGGLAEGGSQAVTSLALDAFFNRATRRIPMAQGFIGLGQMGVSIYRTGGLGAYGRQQRDATWGRFRSGAGRLFSGDPSVDPIDRIEGFLDMVEGVNNVISLLSTACFIIAALGVLLSILWPAAAPIIGPYLPMLAMWGLRLGNLNSMIGIGLTLLRAGLVAARVAQIALLDSDPEAQARHAASLRQQMTGFTQDIALRHGNRVAHGTAQRYAQARRAQAEQRAQAAQSAAQTPGATPAAPAGATPPAPAGATPPAPASAQQTPGRTRTLLTALGGAVAGDRQWRGPAQQGQPSGASRLVRNVGWLVTGASMSEAQRGRMQTIQQHRRMQEASRRAPAGDTVGQIDAIERAAGQQVLPDRVARNVRRGVVQQAQRREQQANQRISEIDARQARNQAAQQQAAEAAARGVNAPERRRAQEQATQTAQTRLTDAREAHHLANEAHRGVQDRHRAELSAFNSDRSIPTNELGVRRAALMERHHQELSEARRRVQDTQSQITQRASDLDRERAALEEIRNVDRQQLEATRTRLERGEAVHTAEQARQQQARAREAQQQADQRRQEANRQAEREGQPRGIGGDIADILPTRQRLGDPSAGPGVGYGHQGTGGVVTGQMTGWLMADDTPWGLPRRFARGLSNTMRGERWSERESHAYEEGYAERQRLRREHSSATENLQPPPRAMERQLEDSAQQWELADAEEDAARSQVSEAAHHQETIREQDASLAAAEAEAGAASTANQQVQSELDQTRQAQARGAEAAGRLEGQGRQATDGARRQHETGGEAASVLARLLGMAPRRVFRSGSQAAAGARRVSDTITQQQTSGDSLNQSAASTRQQISAHSETAATAEGETRQTDASVQQALGHIATHRASNEAARDQVTDVGNQARQTAGRAPTRKDQALQRNQDAQRALTEWAARHLEARTTGRQDAGGEPERGEPAPGGDAGAPSTTAEMDAGRPDGGTPAAGTPGGSPAEPVDGGAGPAGSPDDGGAPARSPEGPPAPPPEPTGVPEIDAPIEHVNRSG